MGNSTSFYKTILLIILAILIFYGFKKVLPARLFPEISKNTNGMLIDSVLLDAQELNDTISTTVKPFSELHQYKFVSLLKRLEKRKPNLASIDSIKGYIVVPCEVDTLLDPTISIQGYGYLQRFYSKLQAIENGKKVKVRVAYYGDSMNDGDFVVQDFRENLQSQFGGNGVGMVSITSMSSASRASVYHKHSSTWFTQSFVSAKKPSVPFGVDGQVFLALQGNEWVSYSAGNQKHSPSLYNPTLYYGYSANQSGVVDIYSGGQLLETKSLTPRWPVNRMNLIGSAQQLKLNFRNIKNIPIYGVDFSGSEGVYVDNFSLRGNSGLPLSTFNTPLINAFDKILEYDLIILHYGTNVLNYGSLKYDWYEKGMTAVVKKLKESYPNADILVISTADKSSKKNMEMVTDPAVLPLIRVQKQLSRDNGVGFIDLYQLMGGQNSMVDWVKAGKANKDYTHFSVKGSKEIGDMLFNEVISGYNKYKELQDREQKNLKSQNDGK